MTTQKIHTPVQTTFPNIRKNADRLIKKNPVRAVVELVTNSDDSYRKLEKKGTVVSGKICIEVIRSRPHSIIEVLDEAEGMNAETMHRVVRLIGKEDDEVAGEETVTRGFFREGLKFALIGMGHGEVHSIKGNKLYRCNIDNKGFYNYDPSHEKPATPVFRDMYLRGIKGNGTIVRTVVSRSDIKSLPLFSNLAESLSKFFSLRDLLSTANRSVHLVELDRKHKEKTSIKLEYKYPPGENIFDDEFPIKDYPNAQTRLEVFKSETSLATKWDVGSNDYRQNGLIIRSGGAIHDITLFKFDSEDYKDITSHLFGFVTCDYIKELMEKGDDQVINDSRDGINLQHKFIQAMRTAIEFQLKKIIDRERDLKEKATAKLESLKIRKLIKKSLSLLNNIARKELADLGTGPTGPTRRGVPIPPDGFNFFPELDYLVIGKKYQVKLIGDLSSVPIGSQVVLKMDNALDNKPDIEFSPQRFVIEDSDIVEGVWVKKISLVGKKVDTQRILTAQAHGRSASAVFIVTKGGGNSRKRGASGLIKDIKFDPTGDPQQRFRFVDGIIKIHTRAPSISRYCGPTVEGQEKLHSRILMAELVTEAIVVYIARQKGLAGKLTILDEKNPQEAIERERNKLQYQYAHLIHKDYVPQNEI